MRFLWSLLLIVPSDAAPVRVPQIDLVYQAGGTVFDRNCAAVTKSQASPSEVAETAQRTQEFQRRWNAEGPAYVKAALSAVGAPFPYRQMQATLTVCVGDMSSPLLISTKAHLSTATRPAPEWYFAFVVFHEIMHHYAREVYETSALRKKYASEAVVTLNHLHVVAMEILALKKAGTPAQLEYLADRYRKTPSVGHRRAWEIVNSEGEEAFIQEMKQRTRRR